MTLNDLLWYIDSDVKKLHLIGQLWPDTIQNFHKPQDPWPEWKQVQKDWNYCWSFRNDSEPLKMSRIPYYVASFDRNDSQNVKYN